MHASHPKSSFYLTHIQSLYHCAVKIEHKISFLYKNMDNYLILAFLLQKIVLLGLSTPFREWNFWNLILDTFWLSPRKMLWCSEMATMLCSIFLYLQSHSSIRTHNNYSLDVPFGLLWGPYDESSFRVLPFGAVARAKCLGVNPNGEGGGKMRQNWPFSPSWPILKFFFGAWGRNDYAWRHCPSAPPWLRACFHYIWIFGLQLW